MAQSLKVQIVGDPSSYQRALRVSTRETQGFGKTLSGLGKTAALSAGAAGIGLLTVALKTGVDEFTESTKVAAQTEAVLKSTGGAANVTAKQVDDLANALMRKSGVDDEAIQSAENLLLGFTRVRNEVGKGNDIFNQATAAILDFSVRTGRDASTAAILFGKALNDPVKGISQLSRVGIQFTKQQKTQIQALVESGHTMQAQKLILAELEKRYGGAAEAAGKTLPGQLAILREEFRNLTGQGVEIALEKLQELRPTFEKLGQVISSLMPILKPLATLMFDVLVTPMKVVANLLTGDFAGAWEAVKKPIQDVLDLLGGVGEVFGGIAGKITGAAADAGTAASNFAGGIWTSFTSALGDIAGYVGGQITGAISSITNALTDATTQATTFGSNILTGMQAGILGFADWVGGRVTAAIGFVTGAFQTALTEATTFGSKILEGMKAGILGFADWVGGRVGAAIGFLIDNAQKAYDKALAFGGKIFDGVKDGIKDLYDLVAGPLVRAVGWIEDTAKSIYGKAKALGSGIYNGLKDGLGALLGLLNSIIGAIRWIEDHKPGPGARIPEIDPPGPPVGQPNAKGGPVRAGVAYPVGEKGVELFVPKVNGTIIPNSALRAGSSPRSLSGGLALGNRAVNITVNMPNYLGDKAAVVQELRQELQKIGRNNALNPLAT